MNLPFSPYWVLARCNGRLLCVKIEIGMVDLWAWHLHARYTYARARIICMLYIERVAWLLQSIRDTRAYVQLNLKVG